jgi:hypothetical protein
MLCFKKSLNSACVRFAVAGATFLYFGLAGTADAGSLFGVSVSASAVANDGCAVSGNYSTGAGGSAPTITNFGAGPSIEGFINCGTSFSGPTAPGLTSASLSAGASDTKPADNPPLTHAGSASSAADLATASLHGYSFSGGNPSFQGTGQGTTDAQLWDELTFTIPGASASTVTNIPFLFSVDGSGNDLTQQEWTAFLRFSTHQCFFSACGVGAGALNWGWNPNNGPKVFSANSGGISFLSDPEQDSLTWLTPSVNSNFDLQIGAILSVMGPSPVIDISADFNTLANGGTVDFSNTAGISFQLPTGTTLNSASGVFGTATAPEPAAFALCGFGLAVLTLRRRGKRA